MSDLNNVSLTGRLTRDAESRAIPNGTMVADVGIASNRKVGQNEEVSFFDLVFWGAKAEFASQYLTKGKAVSITGRLEQQRWEKDGEKRNKVVIVVNDVNFLPTNKPQDEEVEQVKEKPASKKTKESAKQEEEIPF